MDAELQRNIRAFEAMSDELEAHHKGEHVLFHDGKLIGAYPSFQEAAEAAVTQFGTGPYLIREVGGSRHMPMPASIAYRPVHAEG